jgi:hypothetical protein
MFFLSLSSVVLRIQPSFLPTLRYCSSGQRVKLVGHLQLNWVRDRMDTDFLPPVYLAISSSLRNFLPSVHFTLVFGYRTESPFLRPLFLIGVDERALISCPCHPGMARPQVADGGTAFQYGG